MPKKSFKDNPALQFISTGEHKQPTATEPQPKIHYIPVETKSRRVQLLFRQTLHNRLLEIAEKKGISFNELLHTVLEDYADGQQGKNED